MNSSKACYNISTLIRLFKIAGLAYALLCTFRLSAQVAGFPSVKQQAATDKIQVNRSFNQDQQIRPFDPSKQISGLSISADVHFISDSALVRVILVDKSYREYLIYESYPLVSGSMEFSVDNTGEETLVLENITPVEIRFELIDASILLKEISTLSGKISNQARSMQANQNAEKIKNINRHILKRGDKWIAAETSVSKLSYAEKKLMFGGRIPNLQGFEYYAGGIFTIPGVSKKETESIMEDDSLYAEEFSWRNRHGQNWVTPVRNQGMCGSCWAFASAGATEILTNIYFNRHIDYDLAEQQLVSCIPGNCTGGSTGVGLSYIQDKGIINESCFPYQAVDLSCSEACSAPSERIKITEHNWFDPYQDNLKKLLIKEPVSLSIASWNHAVTLVGYKKIKEGDLLFRKTNSKDEWYTILPGDPLIGQTSWLIKNSWGTFFGDNGYARVVLNMNNIINTYGVSGSVTSLVYKDEDILCTDGDGDGYFNWGIGPKPSHCPSCPDQPDGDDSNSCLGPMDEWGNLQPSLPLPPFSEDITIGIGEPVPQLHAFGSQVKWYGDSALTDLVDTGNYLNTGHIAGLFTYYVTQSPGSCESKARRIILKILIPPPMSENTRFCEGTPPELTASGVNIKWYTDTSSFIRDSRDGQIYKIMTTGEQKWLGENLNYPVTGSGYYLNDSLTYHEYGRLYDWHAALHACPSGWSLPADSQWNDLETDIGMTRSDAADIETGFGLLPGGVARNDFHEYKDMGIRAWMWTQTAVGRTSNAYARILSQEGSPGLRVASPKDAGMSVRCIRTSASLQQVAEGNSLKTKDTIPGIYSYYVSQEISGLESEKRKVQLIVQSKSLLPLPGSIEICWGMPLPELANPGETIKWYADQELTRLIHSGNNCIPEDTLPGTYTLYATRETVCGESQVTRVDLVIKPLPVFSLGKDTTLGMQQKLTLEVDNRFSGYEWNTGEVSPHVEIEGTGLGSGTHDVWLRVTDTNHCSFTDTMEVTVLEPTGLTLFSEGKITVYPNPGTGVYTVKLTDLEGANVRVTVVDQNANEVYMKEFHLSEPQEYIPVEMSRFADGVYILKVSGNSLLYRVKIIKEN